MNVAARRSRLRRSGQFTALVDILFATIGIFVIVFALQDIDPPVTLLPAPYDAIAVCGTDRVTTLYRDPKTEPERFGPRDIRTGLAEALSKGGRILIAITGACTVDDGDGTVVIDRIRELERTLGARAVGDETPLVLFEIAPLADDGQTALLDRFFASAAP